LISPARVVLGEPFALEIGAQSACAELSKKDLDRRSLLGPIRQISKCETQKDQRRRPERDWTDIKRDDGMNDLSGVDERTLRNKADPRERKISDQSEQSISCNSAYHSPYHLLSPFLGVYFFFHRPLLISTRCGFPYRSRTIFMPTTRSNRMSMSCSSAKTRQAFQSRKERL